MICLLTLFVLTLPSVVALPAVESSSKPPHILLILADDYGWSDVGYHGSVIQTPNLDQLSADGITLDNYYVQPVCTPTRAALLTGKYPIHTGMQHAAIIPMQPYGLSPNETLLPQRLKEAGYRTHMIGKWHLGQFSEPYVPTRRGFDSFYGFYSGMEDYNTHELLGVLDFRDGEDVVKDMGGVYSIFAYVKRAEQIVTEHDPSKPLFLYLPFQNVHSPVQAPEAYIEKYGFIKDTTRRTHAAMADILDEAIGNVTRAFKMADLWSNTLTVFSTDNGGTHLGGGYNYPLRGEKTHLWEGGVRGVGFVNGEMLQTSGLTSRGLMHVTDWYPTLLHAAGLTPKEGLDGVDMWETIVNGAPSPRKEILHNIDIRHGVDSSGYALYEGMALRMGDMKLLVDVPNCTWFTPPEMGEHVTAPEQHDIQRVVIPLALYNITADPTEHVDLSKKFPDVVNKMQRRLEEFKKSKVPPRNKPIDPRAYIAAWKNDAWGPWK